MYRLVIRALVIFVAALACGCDQSEVDVDCDQYFLSETSTASGVSTKFFYNNDNRISAQHHSSSDPGSRSDYIYDVQGRLTDVSVKNGNDLNHLTKFHYGENGKLIATLRYPTWSPTGEVKRLDSSAIVYDASGRISKGSNYSGSNDSPKLEFYYVVEYPDPATVEFKHYNRTSDSGDTLVHTATWVYVVDSNPRPLPIEYYYYEFAWSSVLLPHNPLSFRTLRGEDGMPIGDNVTYNYEYNEAGYPIKENHTIATTTTTYTCNYSCTAPSE